MYQNLDAASQQLASLQAQLNNLQTKPLTQPTNFPVYSEQLQQIKYVDGLEGAKKFQEGLPPSSSAVVTLTSLNGRTLSGGISRRIENHDF